LYARDQRELTQLTHAVLALAKSSRPDGSCRFSLSAPAVAAGTGVIEKSHLQLISRACNRVLTLKAAPKGLLDDLAQFVDKAEALDLLKSPDVDTLDPGVVARALIESLDSLPCRPISQLAFSKFATQVSEATDMDAAVVCTALETLLGRSQNLNTLKVVQEVTRAVRHIVFGLKSNSLREVAEELGVSTLFADESSEISG